MIINPTYRKKRRIDPTIILLIAFVLLTLFFFSKNCSGQDTITMTLTTRYDACTDMESVYIISNHHEPVHTLSLKLGWSNSAWSFEAWAMNDVIWSSGTSSLFQNVIGNTWLISWLDVFEPLGYTDTLFSFTLQRNGGSSVIYWFPTDCEVSDYNAVAYPVRWVNGGLYCTVGIDVIEIQDIDNVVIYNLLGQRIR